MSQKIINFATALVYVYLYIYLTLRGLIVQWIEQVSPKD